MKATHHTLAALGLALALTWGSNAMAAGQPNDQICAACHAGIAKEHSGAVHKNIGCTTCHTETKAHLENPKNHPTSPFDPKACGACHQQEYKTAFKMDHHEARKSKKALDSVAPDPFFDRALGKHGFTAEHDEPRGHAMMLIDQFVVDRAFGGRYQPKDGWLYATLPDGQSYKAHDILVDTHPDNNEQKKFLPGTAAAVNPVCFNCKTTDHMLDWAYLGDKVPGAKWSRQANPVEMSRSLQHAINCNFCHDPHNGRARIVRDALIEALTRQGDEDNAYTKYATNPVKVEVKNIATKGFLRKEAYMSRTDDRLLCAQCHVEYICNGGIDAKTGKKIGYDNPLTNHFPWKNADDIEKYYEKIGFRDFKHFRTGALLVKMQHPDSETYFGSVHDKAGATCATCHMPKMKDANGKVYTNHWVTDPKNYMKETCLTCHKDKTAEQMNTAVQVMKNHYVGKVREAEARMNDMFQAFDMAQAAGVDESVLQQARELHSSAHINWEYWTAVNGAYFHNHELAMRSLAKSASQALKASDLLRKAVAEKQAQAAKK